MPWLRDNILMVAIVGMLGFRLLIANLRLAFRVRGLLAVYHLLRSRVSRFSVSRPGTLADLLDDWVRLSRLGSEKQVRQGMLFHQEVCLLKRTLIQPSHPRQMGEAKVLVDRSIPYRCDVRL